MIDVRSSHLRSVRCRTDRLYNSFVPSCVRQWNALAHSAKTSPSLGAFKSELLKDIPKKNMLFYFGPREENIALTRLRLNCSALNGYLYRIGVKNSPTWPVSVAQRMRVYSLSHEMSHL